ncbi:hypothetical protein SDC9_200155 [bioreactor metagenome]|uniref:Uncharacterized protein n=1 Tax=bioreactor metagenome TaxID=1076179 RepID=A0A645IZ63_9ZZZZ
MFLRQDEFPVRVWVGRIEQLVGPELGDELRRAGVGNRVDPERRHVDCHRVVPGDIKVDDVTGQGLAQADSRFTGEHDESFEFSDVEVVSSRYPRMGRRDEGLATPALVSNRLH